MGHAEYKCRESKFQTAEAFQRLHRSAVIVPESILKVVEMLRSKQETQNISEALELCIKPATSEPASNPLETSLISASVKPV